VHQFDHFQAFEHAVEEARNNSKIEIILQSELRRIQGENKVQSVVVEHLVSGKQYEIEADGVFVFIGYLPNTSFFVNTVSTNTAGEIIVTPEMETSIKGVFAAGDSIRKRYRQVTTAVSDGTIAALSASEYIRTQV
jgi:thioredoxin reductase (NADPH)